MSDTEYRDEYRLLSVMVCFGAALTYFIQWPAVVVGFGSIGVGREVYWLIKDRWTIVRREAAR